MTPKPPGGPIPAAVALILALMASAVAVADLTMLMTGVVR